MDPTPEPEWAKLMAALEAHPRGPRLTEASVSWFEQRVRFALPKPLRELYLALGNGFMPHILPLMTGGEDQKFSHHHDPAKAFNEASAAFASVLGWHEAHRLVRLRQDPDDVWVDDLLLIADYGCATYFALDLADPMLRVIEYEHLEPTEDAALEAQRLGSALAYTDERVPPAIRLRFVVASRSLDQWLWRWLLHGDLALRASWGARDGCDDG